MRDLKKYDKRLKIKKYIDGDKKIFRDSPFSSIKSFDVLDINNQYLGSYNWILTKLIMMDHQRFNIVGKAHAINRAIRNKRPDDRISREMADFIISGGDSIVL